MMLRKLALILLAMALLTASFCEEPVEEAEVEEEATAAERLQQPRNLYDGNVNENLRELSDDLDEAAEDRARRIEEGY